MKFIKIVLRTVDFVNECATGATEVETAATASWNFDLFVT